VIKINKVVRSISVRALLVAANNVREREDGSLCNLRHVEAGSLAGQQSRASRVSMNLLVEIRHIDQGY
jgi:hypothetical protein